MGATEMSQDRADTSLCVSLLPADSREAGQKTGWELKQQLQEEYTQLSRVAQIVLAAKQGLHGQACVDLLFTDLLSTRPISEGCVSIVGAFTLSHCSQNISLRVGTSL